MLRFELFLCFSVISKSSYLDGPQILNVFQMLEFIFNLLLDFQVYSLLRRNVDA